MPAPRDRHVGQGAVAVFILLALMLLPWLGLTLFNSKGEPREAIVAVSMLESGNWILPVNYGGDIPYKPPFMAWIIAALSYVFNGGTVTEYLSRLPSALASIAMAMAGYRWAARARGARFGVLYALVCATSAEVFRASMACRLDMVLTACMVSAIYLLYEAREGHGRRKTALYAGAWFLLSCATLTKGPVGALLPCCATGAYRLLRGDRFFPTFLKMTALATAALAIPALWYAEAYRLGGDSFYALAYEENIGRLTGTMSYDSHVKPLWYNFATMAAGLLPWTLVPVCSLLYLRVRKPWFKIKDIKGLHPSALLALTAGAVIFCFYCIPESKRSVYLLPAYPFACYGIVELMLRHAKARLMKGMAWLVSVLALTVPPVFAVLTFFLTDKAAPLPVWGYAMMPVPMGAGLLWVCRRDKAPLSSILAVTGLLTFYASTAMPSVLNPRSDARVLPEVASMADEGPVYTLGHGPGERLYTLNFYLGDRLRALPDVEAADTLPANARILLLTPADTTVLQAQGYTTRLLLKRSCDHRRELYLGEQKAF